MSKKYNLAKKSDMRKLVKDLEKEVKRTAEKAVKRDGFEYTCPNCGRSTKVRPGNNRCSHCRQAIHVDWKA